VLDAAKIRAEYRKKKRAHEEDGSADTPKTTKKRRRVAANSDVGDNKTTTIEIKPGESLKHFNRRVEDHMRPLVQSAMRASTATVRKERRSAATAVDGTARGSKARKAADEGTTTTNTAAEHRGRPKEFATNSSARPRRLNDIATAPPVLKKLPRGASDSGNKHSTRTKAGGVLSMAQQVMMETERENVIRRYREMKERKTKVESEQTPS